MKQGPAVSSSAADASSSLVAQQNPQANLMSQVRKACDGIQIMLRKYKRTLLQILYKDWTSEHGPPKDEDLDSLLLESEIAIEKAVTSARGVKPEEMTREWMQTTWENTKAMVEHAKEAKRQLDILLTTLNGQDQASARRYIQLLLERNK